MNMIEIERALRELRLSGIADTLSTRVMQAQAAQQPFLETFASMLQDELDRRRSRLTERRFKRSRLDERPSFDLGLASAFAHVIAHVNGVSCLPACFACPLPLQSLVGR